MIVRTLDEMKGTEREVHGKGWVSTRLLLHKDGMGFSFHETIIPAGEELHMHYKHHQEAVLCIAGEGTLHDLTDGREYRITPGTMYALDGHEKHILRARQTMTTICVFNPPVTGSEVHGEDGAYAPFPAGLKKSA